MNRPILVVEDNAYIRDAVVHVLAQAGYPVVAVPHGEAALSFLGDQDAELIVLDLAMPVMSGLEFLKIREDDPDLRRIPVIVYTAFQRPDEKLPDVCGFVQKHDDPDALLAQIDRCRRRVTLPA